MQSVLMVLQVLVSIALITLILMQHGKGADAGAAFGSGASSTVFGASGSASFLSRMTAVLATIFFAISLTLSVLAHRETEEKNLVEKYQVPAVEQSEVPPAPATDTSDVPAAPAPTSDVPAVPAPTADEPTPAPQQDASPEKQ